MNEYTFLLAIAGVLLIGAMSPGPSFLIVARNSLSKSRAHGIASALGTSIGVSIFAVLASFGVTTLIERLPSAFLAFKILGGAYLLFLAWRMWRGANQPLAMNDSELQNDGNGTLQSTAPSLRGAFSVGLLTQLSNPKTALVIAGVFAAFVPADAPQFTNLLVAVIAFVIDFSWYAVVALVLSGNRSRSAYLRAKTGFDRTASVFLGLIGTRLLLANMQSS